MTEQEYIDRAIKRPAMAAWAADATEKGVALRAALYNALSQIALYVRPPYAKATHTVTVTSDASTYVLRGSGGDCLDIIEITDSDGRTIPEIGEKQYRESLRRGTSYSNTKNWYNAGESGGYPVVTFVDTPSDTEVYTYRYHRNRVDADEVPEIWSWVVFRGIEADLFGAASVFSAQQQARAVDPSYYDHRFKMALKMMKDKYPARDGSERKSMMDRNWATMNRRRNNKYGY